MKSYEAIVQADHQKPATFLQFEFPEQNSKLPVSGCNLAISRCLITMIQLLDSTAVLRRAILALAVALATAVSTSPAKALIVENMTGTTSAPTGAGNDPGWKYVANGGRNYVYLGNGWALSAFHIGVPVSDEVLSFNGGSFNVISNQTYIVKNQPGSGLTTDTDLRLIRINGDPGLAPIRIATQQLFESTTVGAQRDVVIIGNGNTRQASQTQWNVTPVSGANNDIWTEVPSGGQYVGYKADWTVDRVKRWGTNRIADEDPLFGNNDNDFRGDLQLSLGVGVRDVMSMVTMFDSPASGGLTNEAQAISGDSGSSVFHKLNGQWELAGIVNAVYSAFDNQATSNAVYGNYTTFADLSYYNQNYSGSISNIMNSHPYNSLSGDINLDGVVQGDGTGPLASDDVSAFVAGWMSDNGAGTGSYGSWLKGDLSGDGKTNIADFFLLRSALNSAGAGGAISLASLTAVGVPEPSAFLLAMAGAAAMAGWRGRRRRRAAN